MGERGSQGDGRDRARADSGGGGAEGVTALVRAAFRSTPHPGDAFLLGSRDGCEPADEVRAFHGRHDWAALDAGFLDAHYTALGFLSEAGFRFYLPAWLVAELRGLLMTADPLFHLTHGLVERHATHEIDGRSFPRSSGPDALVNPRRYGALTWSDHARHRLAVFTREEATAIVAYLRHRRDAADAAGDAAECDRITQALEGYWLARATSAPPAASLARHEADEAEYAAALHASVAPPDPPAQPGTGSAGAVPGGAPPRR